MSASLCSPSPLPSLLPGTSIATPTDALRYAVGAELWSRLTPSFWAKRLHLVEPTLRAVVDQLRKPNVTWVTVPLEVNSWLSAPVIGGAVYIFNRELPEEEIPPYPQKTARPVVKISPSYFHFVAPYIALEGRSPDRNGLRIFAREFAICRLVSWHPHIATIEAISTTGLPDGQWRAVLFAPPACAEFPDLHHLAKHYFENRQPMPWHLSCALGIEIASALDAVHKAGIVHCDVLMQNILVFPDGNGGFLFKLTDFGLAQDTFSTTTPSRETSDASQAAEPPFSKDIRDLAGILECLFQQQVHFNLNLDWRIATLYKKLLTQSTSDDLQRVPSAADFACCISAIAQGRFLELLNHLVLREDQWWALFSLVAEQLSNTPVTTREYFLTTSYAVLTTMSVSLGQVEPPMDPDTTSTIRSLLFSFHHNPLNWPTLLANVADVLNGEDDDDDDDEGKSSSQE